MDPLNIPALIPSFVATIAPIFCKLTVSQIVMKGSKVVTFEAVFDSWLILTHFPQSDQIELLLLQVELFFFMFESRVCC